MEKDRGEVPPSAERKPLTEPRECWVWYGGAGHPEHVLDRKPKEWADPHWVRMVEVAP